VIDTTENILNYLYGVKGESPGPSSVNLLCNQVGTRDIPSTKEDNLHVRLLLNCISRKTAILTDSSQLPLCRSQNDEGREDGDAEEHFTARMRWLRQEQH